MSPFRRNKNNNKPVIRQVIDLIPRHILTHAISKYKSDKYCSKYKTYDQLVALLFGQLCKCSTLEDISVGIGVSETFIKDLGLEQSPAKSTMSDGNKNRDYQVFEYIYNELPASVKSFLIKAKFFLKSASVNVDSIPSVNCSTFGIFKAHEVPAPKKKPMFLEYERWFLSSRISLTKFIFSI